MKFHMGKPLCNTAYEAPDTRTGWRRDNQVIGTYHHGVWVTRGGNFLQAFSGRSISSILEGGVAVQLDTRTQRWPRKKRFEL